MSKSMELSGNRRLWNNHKELQPIWDFLVNHKDLLDGSELFDDLISSYEDVDLELDDLKEKIEDLEATIEDMEE